MILQQYLKGQNVDSSAASQSIPEQVRDFVALLPHDFVHGDQGDHKIGVASVTTIKIVYDILRIALLYNSPSQPSISLTDFSAQITV